LLVLRMVMLIHFVNVETDPWLWVCVEWELEPKYMSLKNK
jgi:hypothetical protein